MALNPERNFLSDCEIFHLFTVFRIGFNLVSKSFFLPVISQECFNFLVASSLSQGVQGGRPWTRPQVILRGAGLNLFTNLSRSGRQRLEIWCPLKIPVLVQCLLGGLKHFLNLVNWHKIAQIWFPAWNIQYQAMLTPQIEIPVSVWFSRDPCYFLVVIQKPPLLMLGPGFPSILLFRI